MSHRLDFPRGFRWGAATAAAQIEGAGHQDGKGDSIWDVLCRRPGAIVDGSDIEVACDHYHRMPEDVALMKDLGIGTYRFSVSWARVMPDGRTVNPAGLDFYARLVDRLEAAGVTPWLTLYHWDLPEALQQRGGWVNRDTAAWFSDYAGVVYDRLGARVPTWTTLNEPWCSSLLSYAAGEHAPGHTDPVEAVAAVHHLLLGHGLALRTLRSRAEAAGESPEVGITLNFSVVHPADPDSPADADAARRIDGLATRLFADPIFRGSYPADVVEDMRSGAGAGDEGVPPDERPSVSTQACNGSRRRGAGPFHRVRPPAPPSTIAANNSWAMPATWSSRLSSLLTAPPRRAAARAAPACRAARRA